MTTQVSTKVRLVRCPKCQRVLAELPDVPLYKCGGCGTILQAKNRKTETNQNERALPVKDAVANTPPHEDAFGKKETRSSNGDSSYEARESPLNRKLVTYEHGESSKVNCSESDDSTVEVKISLENGENKFRLGQNSLEITEERDVLDEFRSSTEEKESTTEDTQKQDDHVNGYIKRDQNEGEESQIALQEGGNFLVEDQNSPDVNDKVNNSSQDETIPNHLAVENGGFYEEITGNGFESSSVEIVSHENGDSSQTVELSLEVYDDSEDLSTVNSPNSEKESEACIDDSNPPQVGLKSPSTKEKSKEPIDDSTPPQIALTSPSKEEELKPGIDSSTPPQSALKSPSTEEESKIGSDDSTPPHIPSKRSSTTSDDPLSSDNEHLVNQNERPLPVTDDVANTPHEDAFGKKETRSSNGDLSYEAGESPLNRKLVKYEHGESSKLNCSESEDSTVEVKIPLENGENECLLGQNSLEITEERDVLDEFRSSSEEKESTTEDTQKQDDHVNGYIKRDQNEGDKSQIALQEGGNFVVEDHNSPNVKDKGNKSSQDETTPNHLAFENGGFYDEITGNGVESSSAEIVSHENGDSSQTVELSLAAYDDTEDLSTVNSPSSEKESEACIDDSNPPQIALKSPSTEEKSKELIDDSTPPQIALTSPTTEEELKPGIDSSTPPQSALKSPSTEEEPKIGTDDSTPPHIPSKRSSTTSDDPLSSDNEHLVCHHGSISLVDTTGNSMPHDHNSELSIKNGVRVNSPTTRNYYAYDGSESSYDGTDDRIQEHSSHLSRKTINDVDPISSREVPVSSRFRVNKTVSSDQEMNNRRPISTSILQERHHSMKSRIWNENEFSETERERGFTRLPFTSRKFELDHRIGNPSVYRHNPLPPHPGFHSRDEHPYSVPDKMDLLRTVYELKDQLDRIKFPKSAPHMRYPAQVVNEEPSHYYDHLAQERDIYSDSNWNPRMALNPRMAERSNHHRPAFSGEAAHYRHQFNCSCSHCYPQERYHSAQLPSHSSSPQQYTSSEISVWGRETKFDDEQRHRHDEIKRLYLKEKYHTAKRHLRPLAGAAPVLTCYHCLELLQLPEDFLLVEKRCHRLRCNACQKVLKLSRLDRTRLVPYLSGGPIPPPSEAEPVSFSDEYGRSFDRNFSTEEDASNVLRDRKMKSTLKESQSKNQSLMVNLESAGPSSKEMKTRKQSSEIEEERASTLHRLMGYSSPSQVFGK